MSDPMIIFNDPYIAGLVKKYEERTGHKVIGYIEKNEKFSIPYVDMGFMSSALELLSRFKSKNDTHMKGLSEQLELLRGYGLNEIGKEI